MIERPVEPEVSWVSSDDLVYIIMTPDGKLWTYNTIRGFVEYAARQKNEFN